MVTREERVANEAILRLLRLRLANDHNSKPMTKLIRWDPFQGMDSLMADMWPSRGGFVPAVDVYEQGETVVVEAPLAGIDPNDVKISIENDVLTIEGETTKKSEVDDKNYYRQEVRMGSFHRAVSLPVSVEAGAAKAEFADGVLKVTVPKSEHAKRKSIPVEIKKKE